MIKKLICFKTMIFFIATQIFSAPNVSFADTLAISEASSGTVIPLQEFDPNQNPETSSTLVTPTSPELEGPLSATTVQEASPVITVTGVQPTGTDAGQITEIPGLKRGSHIFSLATARAAAPESSTKVWSLANFRILVQSQTVDEGGGVTADNFTTAEFETSDLRGAFANDELVVGVTGDQGTVRLEMVSIDPMTGEEKKGSVILKDLLADTLQTYKISLSLFANQGVDLAHFRILYLINTQVEPGNFTLHVKPPVQAVELNPEATLTESDITPMQGAALISGRTTFPGDHGFYRIHLGQERWDFTALGTDHFVFGFQIQDNVIREYDLLVRVQDFDTTTSSIAVFRISNASQSQQIYSIPIAALQAQGINVTGVQHIDFELYPMNVTSLINPSGGFDPATAVIRTDPPQTSQVLTNSQESPDGKFRLTASGLVTFRPNLILTDLATNISQILVRHGVPIRPGINGGAQRQDFSVTNDGVYQLAAVFAPFTTSTVRYEATFLSFQNVPAPSSQIDTYSYAFPTPVQIKANVSLEKADVQSIHLIHGTSILSVTDLAGVTHLIDLKTGEEIPPTPSNPNFFYRIETQPDGEVLTLYEVKGDGTVTSQILVGPVFDVFDIVDVSPSGEIVVYSYAGPPSQDCNPNGCVDAQDVVSIVQRVADPTAKYVDKSGQLMALSFTEYNEVVLDTFTWDAVVVDLATLKPFDFKITSSVVYSPNQRYIVKDERPIGRVLVADTTVQASSRQLIFQITEAPIISFNVTNEGIYYVAGHDRKTIVRFVSFLDIFSGPDTVLESAKQVVTLPVIPRDRNAIEFLAGQDLAVIRDSRNLPYLVNLKTKVVLVTKVTKQLLTFYGGALPNKASVTWKKIVNATTGLTSWTVNVRLNQSTAAGVVERQNFFFKETSVGGPVRLTSVQERDFLSNLIRRNNFVYKIDGTLDGIIRRNAAGVIVSRILLRLVGEKLVYKHVLANGTTTILGEVGVISLFEVFKKALVIEDPAVVLSSQTVNLSTMTEVPSISQTSPDGRHIVTYDGTYLNVVNEFGDTEKLLVTSGEVHLDEFSVTNKGIYMAGEERSNSTLKFASFTDLQHPQFHGTGFGVSVFGAHSIHFVEDQPGVADIRGSDWILRRVDLTKPPFHWLLLNFYGGSLPSGATISWKKIVDPTTGLLTSWSVNVRLNRSTAAGVVERQNFVFSDPPGWGRWLTIVRDWDFLGTLIRRNDFVYTQDPVLQWRWSLDRIVRRNAAGVIVSRILLRLVGEKLVYKLVLANGTSTVLGEVGTINLSEVFKKALQIEQA